MNFPVEKSSLLFGCRFVFGMYSFSVNDLAFYLKVFHQRKSLEVWVLDGAIFLYFLFGKGEWEGDGVSLMKVITGS